MAIATAERAAMIRLWERRESRPGCGDRKKRSRLVPLSQVGIGLSSLHIFLERFNDLRRFDSVLSSRAIGEGSAVEPFDSNDRRAFPLGLWFRSLPRASHLSLLVQRKRGPKKAHPVGCARRCAPGPRNSRGFSTVHPCTVEKRAASCRAPYGPDPRIPPQPGAPADQDQNLQPVDGWHSGRIFPGFFAKKRGCTSGLGAGARRC
jgi:hypothetical protein